MSKVYIVQQQAGFDMSSAKEFGEVKSIFPPGVQAYFDTDQFVHMARDRLKDVQPDDYLITTGDPVLMGIAFCVMAELNEGVVNVLKWDRRMGSHGGYQEVNVNTEAQPY